MGCDTFPTASERLFGIVREQVFDIKPSIEQMFLPFERPAPNL